jgi:hypothetical protein
MPGDRVLRLWLDRAMALPPWHSVLAGSDELAALGFRFLPIDAEIPDDAQVRVGDIGEFGAAIGRGIGLILRAGEPDVLYARFADNREEPLSPNVENPTTSLGGSVPLVEVPIEPTVAALTGLHERYVKPGSTLPEPGPFIAGNLTAPGERVMCHHDDFKRLRLPLGLIEASDPEDPESAIEDVVELERALIFNGFLTMYQWTLHSGYYTDANGESFRTPYTSMDTMFSRSLVSIDCQYSWAGCHLTLEVDYPPEPDRASVAELLAGLEKDHWPANDQLPDDLRYDVIGAIASMGVQLQPAATQREWLDEGDESTLISQYFLYAGDDRLSREETAERLRELVTPYLQSPHEPFRELVERIVEQHQLKDSTEQQDPQ